MRVLIHKFLLFFRGGEYCKKKKIYRTTDLQGKMWKNHRIKYMIEKR